MFFKLTHKNKFWNPFIFLACFLLSGKMSFAQVPFQFSAGTDTSDIKIGEQFHLMLRVASDDAQDGLRWATVPDTFNHLLVVKRSGIDTLKKGNQTIYQELYTLTGFDSGRFEIPGFQFYPKQVTDSAELINYRTSPIPVTVQTVAVDTSKAFKPIKTIKEVPFNIWDYWPYLLGLLILAGLVLYFVFFYKKKEKKKEMEEKPLEPPYEEAMHGLRELEDEALWQKGEIKKYYTVLTDILRNYINRQFRITALEQTTDELLTNIKPVTQLNQKKDNLKYILETADLAKFAKLSPSTEEHTKCLQLAKEFLEWTRPKQKVEEPEKDKTGKK